MFTPLAIIGLLASLLSIVSSQTCGIPAELRVECGFLGITQGECEARSCCWNPIDRNEQEDFPWCFYSSRVDCGDYVASNIQQTPTGFTAQLQQDKGCQFYGIDIPLLKLQVDYETDDRLHVKITDLNSNRWEVPETLISRPKATKSHEKSSQYRFGFVTQPFGFYVSRADTGEVLFNTTASASNPQFKNLVFEDQYLEISTQLPTGANLYGIGEHIRPLRLDTGLTYTLWNADEPTPVNQNLYGSHPFYLELRNGKAHGVLLLNSNGMDINFNSGSLTYHVLGGVFDFYFFMGPTPASVVQQYTEVIGRPYQMPYWAYGFHQCKYGYKNINEVRAVVENFAIAQIPLEAMWIDIDYMDEFKDWTFDPVNYPVAEVKEFIEGLHAKGQKNVLIVDPAIKNLTGYKYYDIGLEQNIFINDPKTGGPMIGMVWPIYTAFPDFLHPRIDEYWTESIQDFLNLVPVDGLWIDMNEAASFCYGDDLSTCKYPVPFDPRSAPKPKQPKRDIAQFDPNNPNYKINNSNDRSPLNKKTTSMDATHYGGILEYDAHNLYGIAENVATTRSLEKLTNKRAFTLSRSTFPGSGHYGGHWTGDNYSEWPHLYYSISSMLTFQMFGIPFVGADICGFISDTTEELCARWTLLGSFYPFSRNHNTKGAAPQEPYLWQSVAQNARFSLSIRYSLLPLYYTLGYEASAFGSTIVRPLFFQFPSDPALVSLDTQFLIGDAILVSPVIEQGQVTVEAYFPVARWYDFFTYEQVPYSGQTVVLPAPLSVIPLHIRGGAIITRQYPSLTVDQTRKNNFYLVVALDNAGAAKGAFYNDDGDTINPSNKTYITYTATSSASAGTVTSSGSFLYNTPTVIDKLIILGVPNKPSKVTESGNPLPFEFVNNRLTISPVSVSLNRPLALQWA